MEMSTRLASNLKHCCFMALCLALVCRNQVDGQTSRTTLSDVINSPSLTLDTHIDEVSSTASVTESPVTVIESSSSATTTTQQSVLEDVTNYDVEGGDDADEVNTTAGTSVSAVEAAQTTQASSDNATVDPDTEEASAENSTNSPMTTVDTSIITTSCTVRSDQGCDPPGNPCDDAMELDLGKHYTERYNNSGEDSCMTMENLTSIWVSFVIGTKSAAIITNSIWQNYCGVEYAYWVKLPPNPDTEDVFEAELCSYMPNKGCTCAGRTNVKIKNCDKGPIYKFMNENPFVDHGCSGICLIESLTAENNTIPDHLNPELNPITTDEPEGQSTTNAPEDSSSPTQDSTTVSTQQTTVTAQSVEETTTETGSAVTASEANITTNEPDVSTAVPVTEDGVVTIEYKDDDRTKREAGKNETVVWDKDEQFRQFIASLLNDVLDSSQPSEVVQPHITIAQDFTQETTQGVTQGMTQGVTQPADAQVSSESETPTNTPLTSAASVAPSETTTTRAASVTTSESLIESIHTRPHHESPRESAPTTEGKNLDEGTDTDSSAGPATIGKRDVPDQEGSDCYDKDDVVYQFDTPRLYKGVWQISFYVKDARCDNSTRAKRSAPVQAESRVPQDDLDAALNKTDKSLHKDKLGLDYLRHYVGRPTEPAIPPGAGGSTGERVDIWEEHKGLFIAIIILVILCLIVVIIGILCIKCKGRKSSPEKTPLRSEEGTVNTTVIENPIPDEEIMRDEAPMTEAHNPAYTPNGSGHHLSRGDEDNGWIVPMEELTSFERDRPEVDNTRL